MQRTYRGVRRPDGSTAVTVDHRLLPARQDLRDHGGVFEWDASEAGPAQLALAILADHLGDDERAIALHNDVKRRLLRGLPTEGWTLTSEQVGEVVRDVDRDHALLQLEHQLGHVIPVRCERCGRVRRFWGPDRERALARYEYESWMEVVAEDGSTSQVCGDCRR
jgi:hypothetical protein